MGVGEVRWWKERRET